MATYSGGVTVRARCFVARNHSRGCLLIPVFYAILSFWLFRFGDMHRHAMV